MSRWHECCRKFLFLFIQNLIIHLYKKFTLASILLKPFHQRIDRPQVFGHQDLKSGVAEVEFVIVNQEMENVTSSKKRKLPEEDNAGIVDLRKLAELLFLKINKQNEDIVDLRNAMRALIQRVAELEQVMAARVANQNVPEHVAVSDDEGSVLSDA
ncbi:hypothetical protein QVD17_29855 [Tagetes erecta]|uniref:Uncharacterized protein n=1 Tax=Tagetes erecta TaxID=13708 RepID=A0AAD8K0E6_TARER|nr:hypothetical protein QVD17_29855 [Tagetes erecta]